MRDIILNVVRVGPARLFSFPCLVHSRPHELAILCHPFCLLRGYTLILQRVAELCGIERSVDRALDGFKGKLRLDLFVRGRALDPAHAPLIHFLRKHVFLPGTLSCVLRQDTVSLDAALARLVPDQVGEPFDTRVDFRVPDAVELGEVQLATFILGKTRQNGFILRGYGGQISLTLFRLNILFSWWTGALANSIKVFAHVSW